MENEKHEEDNKDKEEKIQEEPKNEKKYKIMKKKTKNTLLNLISYLIYNKNNFEEKIKPSELAIFSSLDSESSTFNNISYKTKINNTTFNPKRDLVKNIQIYKSIPAELEMKDEYYGTMPNNVVVDMYPKIKKGVKLDLSEFPLCSYEKKEKKAHLKDEINNKLQCEENEYILCIYFSDFDIDTIENLDNLISMEDYDKYFKNTFVIIQTENESTQNILIKDFLDKYLTKKEELGKDKDKNKIIFLFNHLVKYTNNKENQNNSINIFGEAKIGSKKVEDNDVKNYFFILDNNKTIVKIKPLKELGNLIVFLLFQFDRLKKKGVTIPFFQKYEKNKREKLDSQKELLDFITNFKKLNINYIFDLRFKLSVKFIVDDEITELKMEKINKIFLEATFFSKEYKYLKQLCDSIKIPMKEIILTEVKTKDIDIDFTKMECEKCKKIISEDEFLYYCYICKVKYCCQCVRKQIDDNKGKARYIDAKHNLLFFKTRDKNQFLNLEEHKLGKNLFAEAREEDLDNWRHNVRCNGCDSFDSISERYICLSCRKGRVLSGGFIDYCTMCIKKMCNSKKEMEALEKRANEVITNWRNNFMNGFKFVVDHFHEGHVYLMVPFSVKSVGQPYYEF